MSGDKTNFPYTDLSNVYDCAAPQDSNGSYCCLETQSTCQVPQLCTEAV